ncbi:DUF84 family protein [Shouchella shacheensis]|uniref:DUF84 family protein n=1 Tax=Shouchella shacheensis TaxID=1649580 RepID=UPI0007405180|nr:DUF84 family protein [Shouchella shacheensis]
MQRDRILAVGTKNRAKVHAVAETLIREPLIVVSREAPSSVSAQPFSDEETKQGAVNRAKAVLGLVEAEVGLGLEGGVFEAEGDGLMICNWGALATEEGLLFTAAGLRMHLPDAAAVGVKQGKELGEVMKELAKERGDNHATGAVGFFTSEWLDRKQVFAHIVQSLYGQYMFATKRYHH